MRTKVLTTDVIFTLPRGRGPGCLCSRCLLPIVTESPVKPKSKKRLHELRYHPKCWNASQKQINKASKQYKRSS